MKKSFKILALLLALLMCVAAFAACGGEEETTAENPGETQGTETEAEVSLVPETHPDIAKKNYGAEFFINIMQDSNQPKYHWVEKSEGDAMSESLYARQEKIHDYLGVEVVASEAGAYQTYTDPIKTAIKNKDDSVHMLLTHIHSGINSLITGNYLKDLNKVDALNLDGDHWTQDILETLELNGKKYLGNSRFQVLYTNVITFNKTMMDQYEDAMGTTVYDLVDNYQWTLDQMISLADRVYIDTTADGKTEDDTFGITGVQWVPFIGFMQASNIFLVQPDESGAYMFSAYNELNQERTATLVEKLGAMVKSNSAWFKYRIEPTPEVKLQSGRALMSLLSTNDLPNLNNYDIKFGILPYPMFDEAQKDVGYRHLQWGGFTAIPSYTADPEMVGETVECLAYFSGDVNNTFYEKLLGKQAAESPVDRRMLELIWGTICADFGQAYSEAGSALYMLPELTNPNGTLELASYVKGRESSMNKGIKKFMTIVSKLKD